VGVTIKLDNCEFYNNSASTSGNDVYMSVSYGMRNVFLKNKLFVFFFFFLLCVVFTETTVINVCSDSQYPRISTMTANYDSLVTPCTLPIFYVQTNGVSSGGCSSEGTACGTFDLAITAAQGLGNINILGTSFSNPGVTISAGSIFIFTTYVQSSQKVSLTFSGSETGPFFTISTGEVIITNLTIVLSSYNLGSFV
jgi:hypothetical protein